MPFDTVKLKQYAEAFEQVVLEYAAHNEDAASLYTAMLRYIHDAKAGSIIAPIKMPSIGRFYFDEGNLRDFRDLGDAFAKSNLALKGYDVPEE